MQVTKLEDTARMHIGAILSDNSISVEEKQEVLDKTTTRILNYLSPNDVVNHTITVYDDIVAEYEKNTHNKDVIDELLLFMSMVPSNACVLDIGCATGRDTLFMSCGNAEFRSSLMGRTKDGTSTKEKFVVPQKTYTVCGVDASVQMVLAARQRLALLAELVPHSFTTMPVFRNIDMHSLKNVTGPFDGIWSCTDRKSVV